MQDLKFTFESDKDVYIPGEWVTIKATVRRIEEDDGAVSDTPVDTARITANFARKQDLPGRINTVPPKTFPSVQLFLALHTSGQYEAMLRSPTEPGDYLLIATVEVAGMHAITQSNTIQVEGEPGQDILPKQEDRVKSDDRKRKDESGPPDEAPVFFGLDFSGDFARGQRHEADEQVTDTPLASPETGGMPSSNPLSEKDKYLKRYFNATINDNDKHPPLKKENHYVFTVAVELEKKAGVEVDESRLSFRESENWTELQVFLQANPHEIKVEDPGPQRLFLPRSGPSWNKIAFVIEPLIEKGNSEISVVILQKNNYIQSMTVKLNIGQGENAVEAVSRTERCMNVDLDMQPRDVVLFIKKYGDGFDVSLVHSTVKQAHLPLGVDALEKLITKAHQALEDIVYMYNDQRKKASILEPNERTRPGIANQYDFVYQRGVNIPPHIHEKAVRHLAEQGWQMFRELFFGDGAGEDARALGKLLMTLALKKKLKIQIVSTEFMLPWGILYISKHPPVEADAVETIREHFLGFKHIIEHIPLQQTSEAVDFKIPADHFSISLNLNRDIRVTQDISISDEQVEFWKIVADQHNEVKFTEHYDVEDVTNYLANPQEYQFLYFYCHASSGGKDPNESALILSGKKHLTLRTMKAEVGLSSTTLPGAPLVFINACESTNLSPLYYTGFMPFFTSIGARGVVGTECKVPAVFAHYWAKSFFKRFLAGGQSIGQIFLDLRREFLNDHHNVLGLMYDLYCDGDTCLASGLL